MEGILSLIALIIILAVLIFVHELGHFTAAKLSGVKVNEFSIGFGPDVWHRTYGETKYSLKLFPLGGFVSMEGEDGTESDSPRNYNNKNWAQKAFILVAGVTMNMVLAFILFMVYLVGNNYVVNFAAITDYNFVGTEDVRVYLHVVNVIEGTAADGVLQPDDVIVKIDDNFVKSDDDFIAQLGSYKGESFNLGIYRDFDLENLQTVTINLPAEQNADGSLLGVSFSTVAYEIAYPASVFSGISHGINMFGYQVQALAERFQLSVEEGDAGIIGEQVGGIVAVGVIVSDIVSSGQLAQLINITALISMSLALVNILPFPALDGGNLVLVTAEAITGKKVKPSWVERLNQVSFVILIILSVLIIFKDIIQFQLLDGLFSAIRSVTGQ